MGLKLFKKGNNMLPIITSLFDTDFYKLTMMQAVFHNYTNVKITYEFNWRNWDQMHLNIELKDFVGRVKDQLDALCELKFTEDELKYLSTFSFFKFDFIEYLKLFKLKRENIKCIIKNEFLEIIINGTWLDTILFETPVLAIISEIYTNHNGISKDIIIKNSNTNYMSKTSYILKELNYKEKEKFKYGDFGTRRRSLKLIHKNIIENHLMSDNKFLSGTSNILLAKEYNLPVFGTQSHEWFQMHQQLNCSLIDSQKEALQVWANEYRGDLGIVLSDCITFDAFLMDFDKYFAKLFDGCRHDSGDPFNWCEKLINHYKNMDIIPNTKTALFSDGLTFTLMINLFKKFRKRINVKFGIGTNLTNDCGFVAPQIVIKATHCNGLPVIKISDSPEKRVCKDQEFLIYLNKIIFEKINRNK